MTTINIQLSDTQFASLQYCCIDPSELANNFMLERARLASEEIVAIYTKKALDAGVQIPLTVEGIIADAYARNWIETASSIQQRFEAQPLIEDIPSATSA